MEDILDLEGDQFEQLFTQHPPQLQKPDAPVEGKGPAEIENLDFGMGQPSYKDSFDLPDLEDDFTPAPDPTPEPEQEEEKPKTKEKPKTPEKPKAPEPPQEEEEEEDEDQDQINGILASSAEYLVKAGIWKDWEGREDEEWDNERWAQELEDQANALVEERYESIKQSNEVLTTIFDYVEQGGDPSKAIELFNRQRSVEETHDVKTDEGKRGYILDYYTKIVGEKKNRADRIIEETINEEGLDTFFSEIQQKYDTHFQKERDELLAEQQKKNQIEEQQKKQLQASVVTELRSMNLNKTVGNELANYVLTPTYDVQGVHMTAMEHDLMRIRSNPKMLVKVAQFLKDPDKYDQMVTQQKQNEVIDKAHNFLRGNKAKSTENRKENSPSGKTTFGSKPLKLDIDLK